MSALAFAGLCLLSFIGVLLWIALVAQREEDSIGVPDAHGDYPVVPDELVEKARAEARLRDAGAFGATAPRSLS